LQAQHPFHPGAVRGDRLGDERLKILQLAGGRRHVVHRDVNIRTRRSGEHEIECVIAALRERNRFVERRERLRIACQL
jgi:hypothetical protein